MVSFGNSSVVQAPFVEDEANFEAVIFKAKIIEEDIP